MKIVMAFGSFDLLHKGHLYYLNESKKHGDKLIVVVARDANIIKFKGKNPLYNEQERAKQVRKLSIADKVILGNKVNIFDILSKIKPDVICLGYDQKVQKNELEDELKKRNIKAEVIRIISYLPDTYKSSKLKK